MFEFEIVKKNDFRDFVTRQVIRNEKTNERTNVFVHRKTTIGEKNDAMNNSGNELEVKDL